VEKELGAPGAVVGDLGARGVNEAEGLVTS
jgi:hypothetical protein